MALSVAVPAPVLAWLRSVSADGEVRDIAPTFGGFSNLTFFARLGDERVVVKAASDDRKRADVVREARMLELLHDQDIGVVTPVVRAHTNADGWAVTVLSAMAGDSGLGVVQTRNEADLASHGRVLGTVLRTIHHAAPTPHRDPSVDADFVLSTRMSAVSEDVSSASLPVNVRDQLMDSVNDPALRAGVSLVHGDFGFHNTLWGVAPAGAPTITGLLDWEWAGWGNPLVDVAWLWWTLAFRQAPPAAFESAADAYGVAALDALGWSAGRVHVFVRAQMAQIIVRTAPESAPREEWLRRIDRLTAMRVPPLHSR